MHGETVEFETFLILRRTELRYDQKCISIFM